MKSAVLTYDAPHRKTQDVVLRMMAGGYKPSVVVATPWIERKPRRFLYAHRPAEMTWPCEPFGDLPEFFENLEIPYVVADKDEVLDAVGQYDPDVLVIGGAGILPGEIVQGYKTLNFHPGLLPARRGYDPLKWCVLNLERVGVTAHLCDEYTDLGWKILEREVPVMRHDTFHAFAMRHYEAELGLIWPSLRALEGRDRDEFERVQAEDTEPTKRMPIRIEAGLLEAFERYKAVFAK